MYGINLAKQTKCDLIVLTGAYLILFSSLFFSVCLREAHWFARSGSVMVLLAVFVEYKNFIVQSKIYSRATEGAGAINGGVGPINQPKYRQILTRLAHFTVAFGTFVWGYGDLLLPFKA